MNKTAERIISVMTVFILMQGVQPKSRILLAAPAPAKSSKDNQAKFDTKPQENQTTKNTKSMPAKTAATNKAKQPPNNKKPAVVTPAVASIPPVKLQDNVTVKLSSDVTSLMQIDSQVISYTLTYDNKSSQSLPLPNFGTKVISKQGRVYTPKLLPQDSSKKSVPAGAVVTLSYVVNVGKQVKQQDLSISFIKWDFSQPNYESKIGNIKLPASLAMPTDKAKTIRLNDTLVNVSLENSRLLPYINKNHIEVEGNIRNIGYKTLEKLNIKFVLQTASGVNYPLIPKADNSEDNEQINIEPQQKKKMRFIAEIPKNTNLKNANVSILQDDVDIPSSSAISGKDGVGPTVTKTVIPLANMLLPKAESIIVINNKPHEIKIDDDHKLLTEIKEVNFSESYDNNIYMIPFKITNPGNNEVTVPSYQFTLINDKDAMYPIQTKALDNLKLKPKESKVIRLSAKLQHKDFTDNLRLGLNLPASSAKGSSMPSEIKEGAAKKATLKDLGRPVAIYSLSKPTVEKNSLAQQEKFVQIGKDNNKIGVKWKNVERLPWTSGRDLLTATLSVRNTTKKTLKIPDLKGDINLDSAETETKINSSSNLIAPGAVADVYLTTEVESNLSIGQTEIELSEKSGKDNVNELIRFTHTGDYPGISLINKGSVYTTSTPGKESEMQLGKSLIYPGSINNVVYTEIKMKNSGTVRSELSKLNAYYKGTDGQYYPAQVIQREDSAMGSGQSNIAVAIAKIPISGSASNMQLIVGEKIGNNSNKGPSAPLSVADPSPKDNKNKSDDPENTKNDKSDETDQQPATKPNNIAKQLYASAVMFDLNADKVTVKKGINSFNWGNYSISTKQFQAKVTGSNTNITWKYDITNNNMYDIMPDVDRKLIVEIKDPQGRSHEQVIDINQDTKDVNNQMKTWAIPVTVNRKHESSSYQVNIYEQLLGQKIKIASTWKDFDFDYWLDYPEEYAKEQQNLDHYPKPNRPDRR